MIASIGGDKFIIVNSEEEISLNRKDISGWIVLHPKELIYINYMGNRVPFCGNATRVLGYLNASKYALKEYIIDAKGPKKVIINGRSVGIEIEVIYKNFGEFSLVEMEGVKHIVFRKKTKDLPLKPFAESIQKVWKDIHFNVYEYISGKIFVRTWEYGYIYEPGGCATGTLACGIDHILRTGKNEIETITLSGDEGRVYIKGNSFVLENTIKLYDESIS